jgi:ATP-dependent DNA helicase RecQ
MMAVDRVKDLLGVLADAGLVERRGIEGGRPGAFVLALTGEGRAVAMGTSRPELDLPAAARKPARARRAEKSKEAPAGAPDEALLARLKTWRTEEARRRGLPPYVVFHDSTLAALAAARPSRLEDLVSVKGVGPSKLAAYGEDLLRLLVNPAG